MAVAERTTRRKRQARATVRLVIPAIYAALLMRGVFKGADGAISSVGAIAALVIFGGHLLWRLLTMAFQPAEEREGRGLGGPEAVEIGFLAVLVLATLPQFLPFLHPWWGALHGALIVGLAFAVRIPEIFLFPLLAVFLGSSGNWTEAWTIELVQLEALAFLSGILFHMERAKIGRLHKTLQRVKLEAEHLSARAGSTSEDGTPKGDLTHLNEALYAYLGEVKRNAEAYSAVLAVATARGTLYVRELVSDSHNVREEAGLDLTGNAFQWIAKNKKPLRIHNLSDAAASLGYYEGNVGVRSFVGVPILAGDALEGVLAVDSLAENAFPDDKLTILNVASHQVMTLLSQIRQLEQVKREARDFKCLHDFSKQAGSCQSVDDLLALALHVVNERLMPDFSAIALVEPQGRAQVNMVGSNRWDSLKGQPFDVSDGLVGWALDSGQYLFYDRERPSARRPVFSDKLKLQEFPTLLIHPFSGQEEPLGALVIGHASALALDSGAIAFADILCHQIALGILQIRSLVKLKEMATQDPLTGLKNRRVFFEAAHEEMKRSRRYAMPLSVLLFDVDHFKKINDVYGHQAGDEALRRVGELLTSQARDTDVVARYGGEEFVMLLPSTDEKGAAVLAERIRLMVASMQIVWEKRPIALRMSVGAATAEKEVETAEILLERADQCLYYAKENGRNRVTRYSEIKEYLTWK